MIISLVWFESYLTSSILSFKRDKNELLNYLILLNKTWIIFLGIILLLYHLDANVTELQRNVSIKLSTDIWSELLLEFEEIMLFKMGELTYLNLHVLI